MKPLGNEISDFEKGLIYGLSLEKSIDSVFSRLNFCVVDDDQKTFRSIWDAWVRDMPADDLDPGLLTDIHFNHPLPDEREKIFATYFECFWKCLLNGVAAQRAFDRKDTDAAWLLLARAERSWHGVEQKHEYLEWEKYRRKKSVRAAQNGGIPGQRVRYKIVKLLSQKQCQTMGTGFPDVTTAINSIDAEMKSYVKKTGLKINADDLAETVRGWLVEHPAFKYELEELFVNDEITDLKT